MTTLGPWTFDASATRSTCLGKAPCWDADAQSLCWIDSLVGTLWRCWPGSGRTERHALPAPVGSIALCRGGVVAGLRNTFARYDFDSRELRMLGTIGIDHPNVRLNDGKCDPFGNFIAGTMHTGRQPGDPILGGLYRLRPDGSAQCIAAGIGFTNGPCFSADGRTLYVADSLVRNIWAYDYAPDAPLTRRRLLVNTDAFGSGPDGAAVDAEGFVWTALPRIGKLARLAPDGTLERMVDLPLTHPTSLCFGGARLSTLYVTSISRSANLVGPLPHDGGVFIIDGLPREGLPAHRYGDG